MRANCDAALRSVGLTATYAVVDLGAARADDVRTACGTPTVFFKNKDLAAAPGGRHFVLLQAGGPPAPAVTVILPGKVCSERH